MDAAIPTIAEAKALAEKAKPQRSPDWVRAIARVLPTDLSKWNVMEPTGCNCAPDLYARKWNTYHISNPDKLEAERIKIKYPQAKVYFHEVEDMLRLYGDDDKTLWIIHPGDVWWSQLKTYVFNKRGGWVLFTRTEGFVKAVINEEKDARWFRTRDRRLYVIASARLFS